MKTSRQDVVKHITELLNKNDDEQEERWISKIQSIRGDITTATSDLNSADERFNAGMDIWSQRELDLVDEAVNSRDTLKVKMKEDWKAINEYNNTINTTTKSVHEETIRIVDAQMVDMATKMQALDDFVTRARSQNEHHHATHIESLKGLANNVSSSYASMKDHCVSTYDRVHKIGEEVSAHGTAIQASLPTLTSTVGDPLRELRAQITAAPIRQYVPTGDTPPRKEYNYPTVLPRTESHNKILGRPQAIPPSPTKSPSKAQIYTDLSTSDAPPAPLSPSKDSLREISLNVHAGLPRSNSDLSAPTLSMIGKLDMETVGMGPPPMKRQATESKLPTKLGGTGKNGVVKIEGRENLGASFGASGGAGGRRLRSSPADR